MDEGGMSKYDSDAMDKIIYKRGLEPLTSTLPFILSIKQFSLPAGFIVEAKSQLASSHSSQMS